MDFEQYLPEGCRGYLMGAMVCVCHWGTCRLARPLYPVVERGDRIVADVGGRIHYAMQGAQ